MMHPRLGDLPWQRITITVEGRPRTLRAACADGLAIHPMITRSGTCDTAYTITHLASSMAFAHYIPPRWARLYFDLARRLPVDWTQPLGVLHEDYQQWAAICALRRRYDRAERRVSRLPLQRLALARLYRKHLRLRRKQLNR